MKRRLRGGGTAPHLTDGRYSRGHVWRFGGGIEVPASASPHVVPVPMSIEAAVDPEEAFVAALASCHMLWFLSLAAKAGYVIESYRDDAIGVMGNNEEGQMAMIEVTLRPAVVFASEHHPTPEQLRQLHHQAHEQCFIANSVKANVRCDPQQVSSLPGTVA